MLSMHLSVQAAQLVLIVAILQRLVKSVWQDNTLLIQVRLANIAQQEHTAVHSKPVAVAVVLLEHMAQAGPLLVRRARLGATV